MNADFRPMESLDEAETLLRNGKNVVTASFYPLYHPPSMPEDLADRFASACAEGNASIFASELIQGGPVTSCRYYSLGLALILRKSAPEN